MLELLATRRRMSLGLIALLAIGALGIWGCADHPTDYDDPADGIVTTKTETALIEAATLAEWIDEGRLNSTDPNSRDKVVVFLVAAPAAYNTGHIAGAQLWNSSTEYSQTRLEGVAASGSMVITGPVIDTVLSRSGVDKYTTIVLTTADDFNKATRVWWMLRYWGFPKERIKILQGGDAGWVAAGNTLVTEAPTVTPSEFSVRDLAAYSTFGGEYRTSIGEALVAVDAINSGATPDVKWLDVRGGVAADAGRIQVAQLDAWNAYYVAGTTATLKPVDEIVAHLATFGVTEATPMTYVNCQGGVKCSVPFFILDGILGWPVRSYNGSWGQWSSYANDAVADAWETDLVSPGTTTLRSFGTWTPSTPAIDPVSNAAYGIADPRGNQIENEDEAYFSSGGTTTTPPGGGGGGGSSGC